MQLPDNDFNMAYTDAGAGIPLLFIHGFPLNRHLWDPQVAGLADVARVLAPDLRGHGDSQPIPGAYTMDIFADDLNSFLDGLGITQPVVVCGFSMGGYTAFTFYRKYSERMAGLILTATRAAGDSPQQRDNRDAAAAKARSEGGGDIISSMLPKLFSPNTYAERPELTAQVTSIMESISVNGIVGDLSAMKGRQDSTGILTKINIPTLVIHGVDDQIIPLDEARQMAAAIPNANLAVIPGAGHLPNLERPDLYNASIRKFLENF